jgi:hypothetical protein
MNYSEHYPIIFKNLPKNILWEGSFYENLIEYCVWNENEFWKLHFELTRLASDTKSKDINKELAWAIITIYQRVSDYIAAHFNPNDITHIENLTDEQIRNYKERLDIAVISVFSGEAYNESSFDLKSPLL